MEHVDDDGDLPPADPNADLLGGLDLDMDLDQPFLTALEQDTTPQTHKESIAASPHDADQHGLVGVPSSRNMRSAQHENEGDQPADEVHRQSSAQTGAPDEDGAATKPLTSANTLNSEALKRVQSLSKKTRQLQAQLNGEKARNDRLTTTIGELELRIMTFEREQAKWMRREKKLMAALDEQRKSGGNVSNDSSETNDQHQASLVANGISSLGRDKAMPESEKLMSLRNEIQHLKQQLQMAQRVVEKEVGEAVPFAALMSGQSNWKGRAEQIEILKAKLFEAGGGNTRASSRMSTLAPAGSSTVHAQERTRSTLRKLESQRRQNLEETQARCLDLEKQAADLKSKYEAARARCKTLSRELSDAKEHLQSSREQLAAARNALADRQQELDALRAEHEAFKSSPRLRIQRVDSSPKHSDDEAPTREHSTNDQATIKRLEQLCSQYQARIRDLEGQRHHTTATTSQGRNVSSTKANGTNPHPPKAQASPHRTSRHRRACDNSQRRQVGSHSAGNQPHSRSSNCRLIKSAENVTPALRPLSRLGAVNQSSLSPARGTEAGARSQDATALSRAAEVENNRLSELCQLQRQELDTLHMETLTLRKELSRLRASQADSAMNQMKGRRSEEPSEEIFVLMEDNESMRRQIDHMKHSHLEEVSLLHKALADLKRVFSEAMRSQHLAQGSSA